MTTREAGKVKVRWEVPDDLPFPMPVDVRIDGKIVTLPMSDGTGEAPAGEGSVITLDPQSKLLRQSDAIDAYQAWKDAQPPKPRK